VPRLAFNQQDAAEALGISVDHFERHIKPALPVIYSGALRLYPRAGLERWLESNAVPRGAERHSSRSQRTEQHAQGHKDPLPGRIRTP
jgi:hypothetical protein